MNELAIITAIREVLLGQLGSVRTIADGTFGEGPATPRTDVDEARGLLALGRPRFDVEIGPPRPHRGLGPSNASLALLELDVTVVLTFALPSETGDTNASARAAVRADAAAKANDVKKALEWAGNLVEDVGGTETGLVSGKLIAGGAPRVRREDWTEGLYVIEVPFLAWALDERAVA